MGNTSLYLATILIWGSSFYAIRHQLTDVPPEVSIFYRFSLATAMMVAWCVFRGQSLRFPAAVHMRFAAIGLFLFNLNFLLIYLAARHLASGLVSVVFSFVVVLNMVNAALFLGDRITRLMAAGAIAGISGIVLVFLPEIRGFDNSGQNLVSLGLALAGTLSASIGMIVSAVMQRERLPVMQSNTWGMFYGAAFMLAWILLSGKAFSFDSNWSYVVSLFYLALFASVLAFACFLTLVGRIGAGKASYATVLFPILALALSTLFEEYTWTLTALAGVALALTGNALILLDKQR